MKCYYLLLLALAPMISSCSADDSVDQPQVNTLDAISFETYVNKSRTEDITNSNIKDFTVYGYTAENADQWATLFDGEKVTAGGSLLSRENSSAWSYNHVKYWEKGKTYKFHAISPSTNANWTFENVSNNGAVDYAKGKITFTNIASLNDGAVYANGEQDLIYAFKSATGKQSDNPTVEFTFSHLLSRVNFKFRGASDNPASVAISVKDIRIVDTYDKGEITLSSNIADATWDISNAKTATLDFGGIDESFTNGQVESNIKYLIPISDRAISYTAVVNFELKAAVNNGTYHTYDVEKEFKLGDVKMLPGYSYTYVIDVNTNGDNSLIEPISFTVSNVNSWGKEEAE